MRLSLEPICINCQHLKVSYGDETQPDFVFRYRCPKIGDTGPGNTCDEWQELVGTVNKWYD